MLSSHSFSLSTHKRRRCSSVGTSCLLLQFLSVANVWSRMLAGLQLEYWSCFGFGHCGEWSVQPQFPKPQQGKIIFQSVSAVPCAGEQPFHKGRWPGSLQRKQGMPGGDHQTQPRAQIMMEVSGEEASLRVSGEITLQAGAQINRAPAQAWGWLQCTCGIA